MFFRTYTLGCKVNQYETQLVREGLVQLGYTEAGEHGIADIVLVNTCTVTAESDLKSRKAVRKLIRENHGATAVVMGCSAAKKPAVYQQISGVCEVITDKRQIPAFLQQLGLTGLPKGIQSFGERHRAYIKIQDGCPNRCSYCIIPKVRPVLSSRPMNEIIDEVKQLSRNGYREIVLTGIHLGYYGTEQISPLTEQVPSLTFLLKRIVQLDEPFRIRLSSLEAAEVSDELIDVMTVNPDRICPHLHLSMQSGSDTVLQRMKRRYKRETFIQRCKGLQRQFDCLALTTDVIVGFPGETEKEFEETCSTVRDIGFSKVHIFRFSAREGTEAATLPNPVPPPVQKRRAETLEKITAELRQQYAASLSGRTLSVLLETPNSGTADRYLKTILNEPAAASQVGQLVNVRVESVQDDVLVGNFRGQVPL
ncbi:MAG: tRNA (N(6)-L-threonylcarbamoyladenosine(37)-C(2))-methylthiotransferase MtaB [Planctomycetaceae bacterium]|jgi:threonylcarbamoyladenosine tRNA methylthiotransferase MtaB|nr:tRNA (N(6)-L-threonylcarbamoyladenosine(37)-C(2))-methylthiotransferase MtaB [Planctomycetaceae bacterium]